MMGIRRLARLASATFREHVTKALTRSPHWPRVRREHLEMWPTCAACGEISFLNVHHIKPFHLDPALELDSKNLITLCNLHECHLLIGHGDSWSAFDPNVQSDAAELLKYPGQRSAIVARARATRLFKEPK
jgi:5-methylcytosine-specific restriction protein A